LADDYRVIEMALKARPSQKTIVEVGNPNYWNGSKEGIQSKDAVTIDAAFQKEQLARLKDVRQQLIDGRLWSV